MKRLLAILVLTFSLVLQASYIPLTGGGATDVNRIILSQGSFATLDALTKSAGAIYWDTTDDVLEVDDGVNLHEVADVDSSQTFTNKELQDSTVNFNDESDISKKFKLQLADLTTSTTRTVRTQDRDGVMGLESGVDSKINYIENYGAETDVTGYSAYADAAGLAPVDGTGGSPTVTITRNTTTPLVGIGDFVITKDAANRQGEGASYDFTIDNAQKSKVQTLSFYYSTSANFDYGTMNDPTDPSDIVIYFYDVTNTTVIQPVGYTLDGSGKFTGSFQATSDSTSYRLIFHVAGTNASAWTMNVDNIVVGPQTIAKGTIQTDWESYTPTLTNLGNATATDFYWERKGSDIFIKGLITIGSSLPTGSMLFTMPSGISFDENELSSGLDNVGSALGYDSGTTYHGVIYTRDTNDDFAIQGPSNQVWNATSPFTWANGDTINVRIGPIKIEGWGGTTALSTDSGNRVVVVRAFDSTTSISSSLADITFDSEEDDTTSSFDGTTFTAPENGYYNYNISLSMQAVTVSAGDLIVISLLVNGTQETQQRFRYQGTVGNASSFASNGKIKLNAGDTVKVQASSDATTPAINNANPYTYFFISKIQSPQNTFGSEKVSAVFSSDAGQSIPDNTVTILDFEDKEEDTHGSVTTGAAWKFTAKMAGTYRAQAFIQFASDNGWEVLEQARIALYKNGSEVKRIAFKSMAATTTNYTMALGGSGTTTLEAGDYIDIRVLQNSDGAISINSAGGNLANVSIARIK